MGTLTRSPIRRGISSQFTESVQQHMVPFDYHNFNIIPSNISEHRRDYDRVRIDNNIMKIIGNKAGGIIIFTFTKTIAQWPSRYDFGLSTKTYISLQLKTVGNFVIQTAPVHN